MEQFDVEGPVRPRHKERYWQQMVGKTIKQVEHGEKPGSEQVHTAEKVRIHFTDGSILDIDIGSNVANLSSDGSLTCSPRDVHLDLALCWHEV